MLQNAAGDELIEPGDVSQQRRACRVHVDAHEAHARLHRLIECLLQVRGLGVVLVQPDADARRVDLYQFAQRVLQPSADRDRAAVDRLAVGEFLATDGAGRVDTRARFVDNDVLDVAVGEFRGE